MISPKTNRPPKSTRIVLVGGCFDVLHYGHIQFLSKASRLGNTLLVALESDENVKRMKGETRPIHTQRQRAVMLKSLTVVTRVILLPTMKTDRDYARLVTRIKPDIIAVTAGDPMQDKKKEHAKLVKAKIAIIPKVRTPSTSQLARLIGLE